MQDKIFLNPEGFIEVVLVGDQTAQMFESIYADSIPLLDELKEQNKPALCLFDLTAETGFSLSSNKAALEILERTNYDKIAMYNVPHYKVTEGIILATGKDDRTKLFKSRDEAVAWLLKP
jgi:hypothetical protein